MEEYFRVGQATDDNTTQRTAGCTLKVTDTNSEYVILIALPLRQWLYERTSVFRYTCISCLVKESVASQHAWLTNWLHFQQPIHPMNHVSHT